VIIRDSDNKFGTEFDRVAKGAGMKVVRTAVKSPLMNARCERFLGSVSWRPRSSLRVTRSGQFRSSLGFTTTTGWPRDSADLRSSHYRGTTAWLDATAGAGGRDGRNVGRCHAGKQKDRSRQSRSPDNGIDSPPVSKHRRST
jgi:hypothetical protein